MRSPGSAPTRNMIFESPLYVVSLPTWVRKNIRALDVDWDKVQEQLKQLTSP